MLKPLILFFLIVIFFSWREASAQQVDSTTLLKRRHVYALIRQVHDAYAKGQNQIAVDSAQKAITIDSALYSQFTDWLLIGVCRYRIKDYQGAVNDLAHFTRRRDIDFYLMHSAVEFKVLAHIALSQLLQAAQTYELFEKNYGLKTNGLQEAAIFYKGAGDKSKFNQLIKMALSRCKRNLDSINLKSPGAANVMEYAELLIIAGKPTKAAKVLKQDSAKYTKNQFAIKNYLLAVTVALTGDSSLEILKNQLKELATHRLWMEIWDFELFDRWLTYSDLPQAKQQELLALQDIVKIKYK